jgi:acetoin utilization deacetylase AcuC-like enzyme
MAAELRGEVVTKKVRGGLQSYMSRRLFYCDHHQLPLPDGHRFPAEKYRMLRERLAADGRFELVPSDPADIELIELAHDPAYVRAVVEGTLDAAIVRRIGFPWSPQLVQRTLCSVGGTLAAMDDALATGWGGNLAGGTHHAFRDSGAGFCVFNDLVIAIGAGRKRGQFQRAAVLDLDVHQGDGTALLLAGDPDAFTVSIHCAANFPFRKQQSSLDLELPGGTHDAEFLATLDTALDRVLQFRPEILFYQSGVDGLASDTFGRFALTLDGLRERDRRVFTVAQQHRIPVVVTLGGGYSKPSELTAEAHAGTFRAAAEMFDGNGSSSRYASAAHNASSGVNF